MPCKIELLFATLFYLLDSLYPELILSTLPGPSTAGKIFDDLIIRIFCEPVNVTLLHNLFFNGKFSC